MIDIYDCLEGPMLRVMFATCDPRPGGRCLRNCRPAGRLPSASLGHLHEGIVDRLQCDYLKMIDIYDFLEGSTLRAECGECKPGQRGHVVVHTVRPDVPPQRRSDTCTRGHFSQPSFDLISNGADCAAVGVFDVAVVPHS